MAIPMIRASKKISFLNDELDKLDRLMELLEQYHKVSLQDDSSYPETLLWCFEHCQGKFRDIRHGDYIVWHFENEEDAVLFAMKWS